MDAGSLLVVEGGNLGQAALSGLAEVEVVEVLLGDLADVP